MALFSVPNVWIILHNLIPKTAPYVLERERLCHCTRNDLIKGTCTVNKNSKFEWRFFICLLFQNISKYGLSITLWWYFNGFNYKLHLFIKYYIFCLNQVFIIAGGIAVAASAGTTDFESRNKINVHYSLVFVQGSHKYLWESNNVDLMWGISTVPWAHEEREMVMHVIVC